MTSTDRLHGLALSAQLSWRNYLAVYPPRIYLLSTLPRVALQTAFFTYLGSLVAGAQGRAFAFVGACAHVVLLATVIKASDVLIEERPMGTLYRVRLGVLPMWAIAAARWTVYAGEGLLDVLVAIAVVGVVVGQAGEVLRLLALAPLFGLIAVTTSAFGIAAAALAAILGGRAEVMVGNLASYGLLAVCGAVVPLAALGPVGPVARLLPITNGLLAVRAAMAGRPWMADALLELAVGAGWFAIAALLVHALDQRTRALGSDDSY